MNSRKKWRIVCLSIIFLTALSSKVYAAEELLDNDLKLNVERLERGQTTTNQTISNNEDLFSEKAYEKIEEFNEKEEAEQVKLKESFFTSGTIKAAAYDINTVFGGQSTNEYTQTATASANTDDSLDTGVLIAVIGVLVVIIIGSVTSYKLFKKG